MPGVVTRASQSQSLFEDGTDQNAVPVWVEKPDLRYNGALSVGQEAGKKNVDCQTDLDETLTPAPYRTAMESEDSGDSFDKPDAATVMTVKKRPSTPHPNKDRRINTQCSTPSGQSKSVRINTRPTRLLLSDSSSDADDNRKTTDHKAPTPATRKLTKTRNKTPSRESTDSDSDDGYVQTTKPRHILKPPKYDGSSPFETFWAQFKNCAEYNKWNRTEELVYLRAALEKETGQVLWDYGSEMTDSLKKLTGILKDRYGGAKMADKYRIEVRNRRRKPGETLRSLHSDIRRLIALAFPAMDRYHRESIACDYFIDALADPDVALKVRERAPEKLDDALRIALQLEVWTKDVERQNRALAEKYVREAGKDLTDQLRKRIDELETQIRQQSSALAATPHLPPDTAVKTIYATATSTDTTRSNWKDTVKCYGCKLPGHIMKECPNRGPGNKRKNDGLLASRLIHAEESQTFITVKYKNYRIHALLDTGSDVTLVNRQVAKRYRWDAEPYELQTIATRNGEKLLIDGVVRIRLNCNGEEVVTTLCVSPNITGVILGSDWLSKPGNVWDFGERRIKIGDGDWIPLSPHNKVTQIRCFRPDKKRRCRKRRKHGDADKLSHRPDFGSSDECIDECIDGTAQEEATVLVRESTSQAVKPTDRPPDDDGATSSAWTDLAKWQKEDSELGPIVKLRTSEEMQPSFASVQAESEFTKRLWNRWDQLEVRNGLLYRRYISSHRNEEYLQLLVPRRCVEHVLYNAHTGMTGGHYGLAKTLYQVKRRFHWNTWRSDTVRYCRRCPGCCKYHCGKLPRQGPLQPVLAPCTVHDDKMTSHG